jgi:Uma2 family endonuclease
MARMAAIPLEDEIYYPESDGKPMGETQLHQQEIVYLIQALDERFRDTPDVLVAGDLLFYYVQGDPTFMVVPDVFVVQGVPKGLREKYLLWKEGRAPSFVAEVTSKSTRRNDMTVKKELYERLGVTEYFLFDPLGEYLRPPLQGFRLFDRRYRPVRMEPDGSLVSTATGLAFGLEGNRIRARDAATGAPLLRREEYEQKANQAEERIRALETEIARLRGNSGRG